jgi:hypothetical protein
VARKKKRERTPTKDDWTRAIDAIKLHSYFDQEPFRTEMVKLARELESDGRAAHRNADWLEGLSTLKVHKVSDRSPRVIWSRFDRWDTKKHSRSAILTKFKRWYDERHFHLIKEQLDQLADGDLRKRDRSLRRQASALLDASEIIDDELERYEEWIEQQRKQRRTTDGRNPSRSLQTLMIFMDTWDLDPVETADKLAEADIIYEPETLKVELWRHRRRTKVK